MKLYLVSKSGKKTAYQSLNMALKMMGIKDSALEDVKVIVSTSDKALLIGNYFIEKIDYEESLI